MTTYTTRSAVEYLQRRYHWKVTTNLIRQWFFLKRLPTAWHEGDKYRGAIMIPEADLDAMATWKGKT